MRRFPAVVLWLFPVVALALLAGCGGKKSTSTAGIPAKIQLAPATVSIALGPPSQGNTFSVSAAVLDANGNAVPSNKVPPIAFKSSDPTIAGVSSTGLICGGAWDVSFVVCNPGSVGTAQITATGGGLTSDPVTVFVHQPVDTILVSPSLIDCKSQGQTQQMTARALSNGTDVTATVGPITWSSQAADVGTFNADINGLFTAKTPGKTSLFAALGGSSIVNSLPATFITCPVESIRLHLQDKPDTSITLDKSANAAVTVDVMDSAGQSVTGLTLTIQALFPSVGSGSIAAASPTNTGTVVATGIGTTSLVPVCASPACNIGLNTQYGNIFTLKVNGASTPILYAASTNDTSLIPINTATTPLAPGTAITLPSKPNSILAVRGGTRVFLGSDTNGSMYLDTGGTTINPITGLTGKVLAASPTGDQVVLANANNTLVTFVGSSSVSLPIPGATAAAYSPDASKLFIIAGSNLYVNQSGVALQTIALGSTPHDIAMLPQGWFVYTAGPGSIRARATCDVSAAGSTGANNPQLLSALPDGTALIAADSPNVDVVHVNSTGAGCPPAGSNALTTAGAGEAFTARQIITLADSSKVFITSNVGLLVYDVAAGSVSKIALAGGAEPFTGGATLDGATVYVGGSDNAVHVINVATGTDDMQIALPFTPDLVAVTPK